MKKQILNLGKALNKAEQVKINGGQSGYCEQEGGSRCCEYNIFGKFCDAGRCERGGCFWY